MRVFAMILTSSCALGHGAAAFCQEVGSPARYEQARTALVNAFNAGARPLAAPAAREFVAQIRSDARVPDWYEEEVEGLADGFERLAELSENRRNFVLDTLSDNPSPRENAEAARAAQEKALSILREVLPAGHPAIAEREYYLSNLFVQLGQWDDALQFARQSVETAVRWRGESGPEVAGRAMWLGWVLFRAARNSEAAQELERAHAIFEELDAAKLGVYESARMHLTNYRGVLSMERREFERAEALLGDYAERARRIAGPMSSTYLTALSNLHSCFAKQREFDRALTVQYECVAQAVRALPDKDSALARFWYNLGATAQSAGRLREALHAYENATAVLDGSEIRREVGILALVNRAEIGLLLGDEARAISAAETAIEALRFEGSIAPDMRDGLLDTVIYIFLKTGEVDRAAELIPELERIAGTWPKGRVALYRAHVAKNRGSADEALAAWRECLSVLEPGQTDERLVACTEIGELLLDRGDVQEAAEFLARAEQHYLTERGHMAPKYGVALMRTNPYPWIARAAVLRGDAAALFAALEDGSSRTLLELLERTRTEPAGETAVQLADLEQQAAILRTVVSYAPLRRTQLKELESQILELRAGSKPERALGLGRKPLAELQESLESDEAYIGWFDLSEAGGSGWIGWILRSDAPVAYARLSVPAGRSLASRIGAYKSLLHDEAASAFSPTATSAHGVADELGETLFRPMQDRDLLDGVEHLCVVTRGIEGLPIESLRIDGEWVDERMTLSYAPSCSLHAVLRSSSDRTKGRVLVIADPVFGDQAGQPAVGPAGDREEPLRPLPATRREAEFVAAAFASSTSLQGPDADERTLREFVASNDLRDFTAIHFATHAIVDGRDPATTRVALSQQNLPDPLAAATAGEVIVDGFLTVLEIQAQWQLDADLVTLSACRSALGANIRGEGYVGLTTTFLTAGARSVVATQWDVQDEPTQQFMRTFYGELAKNEGGRRKARAMREARRALREFVREGERPYAHPAFWTAFALTGAP